MGNMQNYYNPGKNEIMASTQYLHDDKYQMYVTTKKQNPRSKSEKHLVTINYIEYGLYLDDMWL